jgi:AcrR family transcriptional regulator
VPYKPEHKLRTRARIVESARIMFNRHGFEQVSIDQVMQHAGLTRGGFYHHFPSKTALYSEAVHSFVRSSPFSKHLALQQGPMPSAAQLARMLVELYLSDEALKNRDEHCPLIALPSDVARAGAKPRAAYTQLVRNMLKVFRGALPARDRQAERKAQLVLNLCVGGMIIARTTDDPSLRKSLRTAALEQALSLLGFTD